MPIDLHSSYRIPIRNSKVEGELIRKKAPLVICTSGAFYFLELTRGSRMTNGNHFPKLKPLEPVVILALDARADFAELTADLW